MPSLPVDVLWIARYDYRPGWSLQLHCHDYFQMIFFLDGKGVFTLADREYPIRGGELFLIDSARTHGLRAESLVRTLDVKFRVAPGQLSRQIRRAAPVLRWNAPSLAARFERIREEGDRKPPFYRELCSVLLSEILFLYLRKDPNAMKGSDAVSAGAALVKDPVLERAIAFVEARYRGPLTVHEIARAAGCSERTLRLHFQAAMQVRPLAFLQRHRIAQAKALIQYSDYPLKEIAEQVGFQTIHHFTRHFTAAEGLSPAAWQRQYLGGIRRDIYIDPGFENRILTIPADS